jgi:hypothetical protein
LKNCIVHINSDIRMELFRTVKLCITGENSVFWNDILCLTDVYSVCIGTQFDLYSMLAPNLSAINGDQLQLLPTYNGRAAKSHGLPMSLQILGLNSMSHRWTYKSLGISEKLFMLIKFCIFKCKEYMIDNTAHFQFFLLLLKLMKCFGQ